MHSFGNIFRPLSTPADYTFHLSLLMLAICAAIFITVVGLLIYAIIRFGRRPGQADREQPQVYGSNQIEIAWTDEQADSSRGRHAEYASEPVLLAPRSR